MSVLLCLAFFVVVSAIHLKPVNWDEVYKRSMKDFNERCQCCGRRK